eukprot:3240555-Amphidinium_carterae.1
MALRRATSTDAQGVELVSKLLPELVGHIPRNRRVRDLTEDLPGDGTDQVPQMEMRLPPTPRLPGTPVARTRRLSVVSTTAPSGRGEEQSQVGTEPPPATVQPMALDEEVNADAEVADEPETAGRASTDRSVRRRLDPMVEAQVRRIEGPEAAAQMFQHIPVPDWPSDDSKDVNLSDACAVYSTFKGSPCFVVTRKATDELDPSNISSKDWPLFEAAIRKEGTKMLEEFRGLEVLSLEESERVRSEHADRILPSRLHLRWKTESTSQGITHSAKARWILVGFHDPDVLKLDGAAPTPQLTSLNIVLQVLSSLQFEAFAGDFSTAFLQGEDTLRLLWVTAPRYCEVLGLDRRQLLRVKKEVYGSVAAPQHWRQSLVKTLTDLGWAQSLVEPCVFTLQGDVPSHARAAVDRQGLDPNKIHNESAYLVPPDCLPSEESRCFIPVRGIVVVLVDDIIEGGDSSHRSRIDVLKQKYSLGQHKSLMTKGGTLFNGRRVEQMSDFSFRVSMRDFITTRLQPIKVPRERKRDLSAALTEDERTVLRTVLMKILWIARQCRPEVQGSCSVIASRVPTATVAELVELSKVVDYLLSSPHASIRIHAIPVHEWCLAVFCDAAPNNGKHESALGGFVIGVSTKALNEGRDAPLSILSWRSGKIERQCSSSLASESFALVNALAYAEWLHNALCSFSNCTFDSQWARARLAKWHSGETIDFSGCVILRDTVAAELRRSVVVTDAKSLFDSLQKEAGVRGREPRIALAAAESREAMSLLGLRPRWTPHNVCIVDPLTKQWSKSNATPLIQVMKTGSYLLAPEGVALQDRAEEKETSGFNRRAKGAR